jgi:choline dehydrogenase-like flavoprotein
MRFASAGELARSGFRPRVHIVGTGPAGLSLALRLEQHRVPCLLIEAGELEGSAASQDFYRGELTGDQVFTLHDSRLRQFGGTSGHWSGWCRALDAIDFEPRDSLPHSGWPIRKADLDPYAAAAAEILRIKPTVTDAPLTRDIDAIEYRFSAPLRFGPTFRSAVERSQSIGLLLETAVKELVPGVVPGGSRVAALRIVDAQRAERDLPVETVCVCTGGIENSRLLLWSNLRYGGAIVRHATMLGRGWMCHPVQHVADAVMTDAVTRTLQPRQYFAVSPVALQSRAIGGAHLWLSTLVHSSSESKQLVRQLLCVAPSLFERLVEFAGSELLCGAQILMGCEQTPTPDNRVELDPRAIDAHGVPRVRLHWKRSAADRRTARIATQLFGEAMVQRGLGRVRMRRWLADGAGWPPSDQGAGKHHIGGTRMADSPAAGVVDRNCKVHGVDNLYIAGSSVFATGGHANPTFTIVQLALRLGDHLAAART